VLFPVAAAYALFLVQSANSAFVQGSTSLQLLIVASGPITAIPLIMFAAGARRIKLATLGFLQYIAPSLQFAVGTLVYGESMSAGRLAGFAIIWIALAVYTAESLIAHRPVSTTPPE
jgi:chloramphenicol-sensitive protein RarD